VIVTGAVTGDATHNLLMLGCLSLCIVLSGFLLCLEMLERRFGSFDLRTPHGLYANGPLLANAFLCICLVASSFSGTVTFFWKVSF